MVDTPNPAAAGILKRLRWSSVLLSLWTSWIIVTLGDLATLHGGGERGYWSHIPYAIFNFFTPMLFGNARLNLVPLLLGVLLGGDLLGRVIKWPAVRVIYNLVVLVWLTATIDIIVQGSWMSRDFLLDAFECP